MTAPQSRTLQVMADGLTFPQSFASKAQIGAKQYAMDWTPLLGVGATITAAEWRAVEGDLVFADQTIAGLVTTATVSGGNEFQVYTVAVKVTTGGSPAETIEVSAPLLVRKGRF